MALISVRHELNNIRMLTAGYLAMLEKDPNCVSLEEMQFIYKEIDVRLAEIVAAINSRSIVLTTRK